MFGAVAVASAICRRLPRYSTGGAAGSLLAQLPNCRRTWLNHLPLYARAAATNASPPEGASLSEDALPRPPPKPHPISQRFAFTTRSFYPIYTSNLRDVRPRKKKKRLGKGMSGRNGLFKNSEATKGPHSRTWEGGTRPLVFRLPRWPAAANRNKIKKLDSLNLSKLRYNIEKGRLDSRFPITQRHLYDSQCVTRIKRGVSLFNVNDFPFPYKIDIEVAGADQSSIDAIKAVGGTVTIVYMQPITLRAHIKPWKYEVLPRTARPTLQMVHYLEKMKARGAVVRYVKPLWLIEEERRLQTQLREVRGADGNEAVERIARANERMY